MERTLMDETLYGFKVNEVRELAKACDDAGVPAGTLLERARALRDAEVARRSRADGRPLLIERLRHADLDVRERAFAMADEATGARRGSAEHVAAAHEALDQLGVWPETTPEPPNLCSACAGTGAQLCECDRGERPAHNCWACSG